MQVREILKLGVSHTKGNHDSRKGVLLGRISTVEGGGGWIGVEAKPTKIHSINA